jgi:hypothetical protein
MIAIYFKSYQPWGKLEPLSHVNSSKFGNCPLGTSIGSAHLFLPLTGDFSDHLIKVLFI